MSSYESFARVYDELMDEVPYEEWAEKIIKILDSFGIRGGLMLELGCGTGKMTEIMAGHGFDMIGVDSSVEMLQIARDRDVHGDPLYLLQDMRDFELYGTVRAVISVCDSINYIIRPEELLKVFRLVNNYLDPGGIFIFDFNTDYKYSQVIGNTVIAEDREDISFIWYNEYDKDEHINCIDLSVFVRESDGRYQKFNEEHIQRGYTLDEIKQLIDESGLEFVAAYDGYNTKEMLTAEKLNDRPDEDDQRIVIVAKENGKSAVDE